MAARVTAVLRYLDEARRGSRCGGRGGIGGSDGGGRVGEAGFAAEAEAAALAATVPDERRQRQGA